MAIIHPKGLLEGKRLRRCKPLSRFLWPYLYAMSNGLARLELDTELLEEKLLTFREMAPSAEKLEEVFADFQRNHLLLVYPDHNTRWGQWDITGPADLKKYVSTADWNCPVPPEPRYTEWLEEQHGEKWAEHHTELIIDREGTSKTRAEAGRKGGRASAENRKKQEEATSSNPEQGQANAKTFTQVAVDSQKDYPDSQQNAASGAIPLQNTPGFTELSTKSEQTERGIGTGVGVGTGVGGGIGVGQPQQCGSGLEKPGTTAQPSAAVPKPIQNPVPGSGTVHTPASLAWLYDFVVRETGHQSTPANPEDFRQLPARQYGETALDIAWMWHKSKYWPEKVHSTADFVFQLERARGGIRSQRRNWCKTDAAKQEVARLLTKYEAAMAEAGLAAYPHDQPGQRFDVEDLGE